ncbi:MAG: nucleotidyltransferase family protein [Kordiimonadaceae bacterium]|nr:nucleotidyltransferase family protein [Kordiimonadaceae bacterium]MBO6570413.1 nucleotidyltransferase family protein [Kordiimonadaceae bacterium]MBO6965489.1 nucleotidyltransferase family protein [Kordiimonadaceae bacterium]
MIKDALRIIVGLQPLPKGVMDRIDLIRFADANHILGQMAFHCHSSGSSGMADVFSNAKLRAAHDHTMLTYEMNRVERALAGLDLPVVVLKGGAYVASSGRASLGRRVSDLDILVRPNDLQEIEQHLLCAGWQPDDQTNNEYDQQYYRQHMHELPPLRHKSRGTVIDVHHALLPITARNTVDEAKMFSEAHELNTGNLKVFSPVDQIIHSAVHAYADGALDTPARTLVEQYFLFTELTEDEKSTLVFRAREVGAQMSVALGLWMVGHVFDQTEAKHLSTELRASWRYPALKFAMLNKLRDNWSSFIGKGYLYIRSHYLRMPLYMLIPHLMRKAIQWRPTPKTPPEFPFPQ